MLTFDKAMAIGAIGKIVERLFLARIRPYVVTSQCFNSLQSHYQHLHTTEAALTKFMTDICEAACTGRTILLVAFDMLAAFDTIDHFTLMNRRSFIFGIKDTVLQWLSSYLDKLSSFVKDGFGQSA